ncbi:MAG: biopolymer transporter ExbD [Bacteroidales bacterium]
MPKVKIKRKSTRIDMTAMSDVTVLLLTFFMLTSTFIQKEPVLVVTPASVSEIKIPETNILQILVDPEGHVFLSMDKQEDRAEVSKRVAGGYDINFSNDELKKLKQLKTFGVPINKLQAFLALPMNEQDAVIKQYGIPCDSTNNEFKLWIKEARAQNPELRIAIKADQNTPYKQIKMIMSSLQELRENRYNLITSLKNLPPEI